MRITTIGATTQFFHEFFKALNTLLGNSIQIIDDNNFIKLVKNLFLTKKITPAMIF